MHYAEIFKGCKNAYYQMTFFDIFENNGYIHVYSPGTGADNTLGSNVFIYSIIQSIKSFAASFPPLNDFVKVSLFKHTGDQV